MTRESRSIFAHRITAEKYGAWGVVVAAHVLFAWVVTRPSPVVEPPGLPMMLIYIDLPPPVIKRTQTAKIPPISAEPSRATRDAQQRESVQNHRPVAHAAAPTAQATTADDRWETLASTGKDDPIVFPGNDLMHRVNPIQMGPPERFRMRKPLSPEDIVRMVSMGLFWPPGYTDDPCGGIERVVRKYSRVSTARERKIFEDAVKEQQRYCM